MTHDYSANCVRGCGRVATIQVDGANLCSKCWIESDATHGEVIASEKPDW